jgi:hypothetical protein
VGERRALLDTYSPNYQPCRAASHRWDEVDGIEVRAA